MPVLLALAFAVASAVPGGADPALGPPSRPGREICLPPSQVKDTFFSYLIGIIQRGVDVDIDNDELRDVLFEFRTTFDVPFDLVSRVRQYTDPASRDRTVSLEFQRPARIPIPYSILFYRPGRIVVDPCLVFQVRRGTYGKVGADEPLAQVIDLRLVQGRMRIDIDEWLEVLFRSHLEDADVRNIVFFTWDGEWLGLLQGTGMRTGRTLRSYFNFTRNKILYPVPPAIERAGRSFTRGQAQGG